MKLRLKILFFSLILAIGTNVSAQNTKQSKKDQKTYEIRTAPLAFWANWITVDLSYISKNWAFGPSYVKYANTSEYGNMFLPTFQGNAIGAHFIYASSFNETNYYLGGHTYYEDYYSYPHGGTYYRTKYIGLRTSLVVGYRLASQDYSMMMGVGAVSYNHQTTKYEMNNSISQEGNSNFVGPFFELKIGLMF